MVASALINETDPNRCAPRTQDRNRAGVIPTAMKKPKPEQLGASFVVCGKPEARMVSGAIYDATGGNSARYSA